MSNAMALSRRPATVVDADTIPAALEYLRSRYRDAVIWFGESTHRWWAMVDDKLVDASTVTALDQAIWEMTPQASATLRSRVGSWIPWRR